MTETLFGPNLFARVPKVLGSQTYAIEQGDAVWRMTGLPPESVDLICTDPPYASLEKHRAMGTTTRLTKAWFQTVPNAYFEEWFRQAYRVLRPDSHCYVICDAETMFEIVGYGVSAGFRFWKPVVWDKCQIGMGYHYRNRCEFILFFEKGKRRLNDLGVPDVLRCKRVRGGYPTEKPVPLLRLLIGQSTASGNIVLDPFCGSGSTGEAALQLRRRFIGFDTSAAAADQASARCGLGLDAMWSGDWRDLDAGGVVAAEEAQAEGADDQQD